MAKAVGAVSPSAFASLVSQCHLVQFRRLLLPVLYLSFSVSWCSFDVCFCQSCILALVSVGAVSTSAFASLVSQCHLVQFRRLLLPVLYLSFSVSWRSFAVCFCQSCILALVSVGAVSTSAFASLVS